MRKYFSLIVLALSISACDEKDPDAGTPFLTIEVTEYYDNPHGPEQWIFATNEYGTVMDVVQVDPNVKTVQLRTGHKFERMDLTVMYILSSPPGEQYSFHTYKGHPTGGTFFIGPKSAPTPRPSIKGTARISITNYSEPTEPTTTIRFSTKGYPTNYELTNTSLNGSTYQADVALSENDGQLLVNGTRDGIPVYAMLEHVKHNETRTVDFQTMETFENLVPVNYKGFAYTVGLDNDNINFELLLSQSHVDGQPMYAGTVPGFSRYLTYIKAHQKFDYTRVGSPITSFNLPSYTVTTTNNNIRDFEATITDTHDYKVIEFSKNVENESIFWVVNADQNTAANLTIDIPDQIKKKYPSIGLDDVNYYQGTFFRSFGTYTYQDMLNYTFGGTMKAQYELYALPIR